MTQPTPPISDFYAPVMRDRSLAAQKLLMQLLKKKIPSVPTKLVAAIEAAAAAEAEQSDGEFGSL